MESTKVKAGETVYLLKASDSATTTLYLRASNLLDADMRNPSMHKIVGIANRDGLSSLLVVLAPGDVRFEGAVPAHAAAAARAEVAWQAAPPVPGCWPG